MKIKRLLLSVLGFAMLMSSGCFYPEGGGWYGHDHGGYHSGYHHWH